MKTIDLFPPCTIKSCPELSKPGHKHILPQQQDLLDSSAKYIAQVGGYGSGKTLVACIMGHCLSMSIPGNMGIVVRRTLPKLHDATQRIYMEVLNRSKVPYQEREKRDGWPGTIVYPNGSEVKFRETKDLGRFLGPEYGWFLIDEAQEEPQKTFTDLGGRLRLPRASKYLRGMLCTNPPPRTHWIAKKFPSHGVRIEVVTLKDGTEERIKYQMIRSSTYDNPFLDSGYVATLLAENSPEEVKRIVEGFYGFTQEGRPVYPMFDFTKHVADLPARLMTTYRVWDFGFHCPAVTWHQMFRCKQRGLHWVVLHEVIGENIEAIPFGQQVMAENAARFSTIPPQLFVDGGDAAGAQVGDRGPGPIILLGRPRDMGGLGLRFNYEKFPDVDPGLDRVRECLRTVCKCGFPLLMLNRTCRVTIEALSGGYHYPKEGISGSINKKKKPVKDGYYDNPADTVRYAGLLFYDPLFIETDPAILRLMEEGMTHIDNDEEPGWAWMERVTNKSIV